MNDYLTIVEIKDTRPFFSFKKKTLLPFVNEIVGELQVDVLRRNEVVISYLKIS